MDEKLSMLGERLPLFVIDFAYSQTSLGRKTILRLARSADLLPSDFFQGQVKSEIYHLLERQASNLREL